HPNLALEVVVNDLPRTVIAAPDLSFVIKELPRGTSAIAIWHGEASGYLTLDSVEIGEVIEILVRDEIQKLTVELIRRERDRLAYNVPSYRPAGLQITAPDGDYFVQGGLLLGNLEIDGSGVRVFGRNLDEPCEQRARTVFSGDLILRGDGIEVYDVA